MKPLTAVMILLLLWTPALAVEPHGPRTTSRPEKPAGGAMPAMPPMIATGSIGIKVVQGTRGGPKIGADEVIVELYGHAGKISSTETKLDAHGVATIENLPLGVPFQPKVTVQHGGTSYTEIGAVMDPENPVQDITVTVFETSDKNPQWEVAMWRVIVQPGEKGGMKIAESLAVSNKADSAYLGPVDAKGRRTSVVLSLPKGAKDLKMSGGLHDCCASVVDGRLLSKAPLTPGDSQLDLNYTAPMPGGTAEVNLVAPAAVKQLMVFVPKGTKGFQSDALKAGAVMNVSNRLMQSYVASDVTAGRKISFVVGAMPAKATTGSIAIKAVQGTKGGPKIGADTVIVELYGRGGKLRTIETKLDADGVVMIEDLPLGAPFQPKVTVQHAGASYTKIGEIISPEHPARSVSVTVHETSDKDPQLQVAMWHLIVQPAEKGGMKVVETLAIRNLSDSAYLGTPDAEGRRISIALSLPKGVKKLDKIGGALDECCTSVVNGRLLSKAPLVPNMSQLVLEYTVPTPEGSAEVSLVAPAAAKQLMVFVPTDIKGFGSDSLKPGDTFTVRERPMQSYMVSDVSAGQTISFSIGGMGRPVAKASIIPKVLAALGGLILIVLCVVVLLIRRPEEQVEVDAV